MNTPGFLDAVRDRHGLTSDNKLAVFLDMNRGLLSAYRTGRRTLSPADARLIAAVLDVDAGYVMASIQAERAKRTEDREVWVHVAQLVKKANAATVLGWVALLGLLPATLLSEGVGTVCILC